MGAGEAWGTGVEEVDSTVSLEPMLGTTQSEASNAALQKNPLPNIFSSNTTK